MYAFHLLLFTHRCTVNLYKLSFNNSKHTYTVYVIHSQVVIMRRTRSNLLSVCCQMNCVVRKQTKTRSQVSFPKPSKSLSPVDDDETLPETVFAVKSSHLAFNFHHLQRGRDGFAEEAGEACAHEALAAGQPVVGPHRGHRRFGLNSEVWDRFRDLRGTGGDRFEWTGL